MAVVKGASPLVVLFATLGAAVAGGVIRATVLVPNIAYDPQVRITDAEAQKSEVYLNGKPTPTLHQVEVLVSLSTRKQPGSVANAKLVCGDRVVHAAFMVEETAEDGSKHPRLSTGSILPKSWHTPNMLQLPAMLGEWETRSGWLVFINFTMPTLAEVEKHGLKLETAVNGRTRTFKVKCRMVR